MTNPRPPAPADPWKDVTKLQASLVRDRYEWVYFASDVDAARLATEQQHQQELERLTLLNANQRQRLEAERDAAQVQCADAERFANKLEQHTARLRAALEDLKTFAEAEKESARIGKDRELHQFYSGYLEAIQRVAAIAASPATA